MSLRLEALEQARLENERLQRLLGMTGNIPFRSIGARVVGRTPNYMSNTLYVDRGWEAGVTRDDPVLSAAGILGRVVLVSRYYSQVQLITNADASTGVMVEHSRSPGVLKGSGDSVLSLEYISNTEQVDVGDNIVSSGLDGIYPKGLSVGKVIESRKGTYVFRIIRVQPSADLLHVEEVLVLSPSMRPIKENGAELHRK
jgi:rod shape-determining protein MreC